MTTYQTAFLSEILSGGDRPLAGETIPPGRLAYFQERLKGRVHSFILREFLRQKRENPDITQAAIARRLGKRPEQINRWLSGPSNLTLETISDLTLAIFGGEPKIEAQSLKREAQSQNLGERQSVDSKAQEPPSSSLMTRASDLTGEPPLNRIVPPAKGQSDITDSGIFAIAPGHPPIPANSNQLAGELHRLLGQRG